MLHAQDDIMKVLIKLQMLFWSEWENWKQQLYNDEYENAHDNDTFLNINVMLEEWVMVMFLAVC